MSAPRSIKYKKHEEAFENVEKGLTNPEPPATVKSTKTKTASAAYPTMRGKGQEEIQHIYNVAKQFVAMVERQSKTTEEVEPQREIKDFDFKSNQGFLVFPILGGIDHPMLIGTPYAKKVSVGSRSWLICLDQLRTYGWPLKKIQAWLDKSAEIVKRDALFDCWREVGGVKKNFVEQFCMIWPDPSREPERLAKNTQKVLKAIRDQYIENPFRPQNYQAVKEGTEKPKAPPVPVDFKAGGEVFKNVLRNFTLIHSRLTGVSPVPSYTWECTYPKGKPWIPEEYREKFEAMFNLTPYAYIPAADWKEYMLTMYEADQVFEDKNEEFAKYKHVVETDKDGKLNIIAPGNGTSWKIYTSDIPFAEFEKPCADVLEGERSLREWCNLMTNPEDMYPLIYVLLNVRVPVASPQFSSQEDFRKFVYEAYYNGQYHPRLIADAPLKLFRALLIRQYSGLRNTSENETDCYKRFLDNVWAAMKASGLVDEKQKELKKEWSDALDALYILGDGDYKCYDSSMPLTNENKLGIPQANVISREDLSKLSLGELLQAARAPAAPGISVLAKKQ